MAFLRTLEGVENSATSNDLEDLFNTNDVLGCMIYGPNAWNAVKTYAGQKALDLLASRANVPAAAKKIFGKKNYIATNDILDRCFGFNHKLGVELLGAEEWGEFVADCKLYEPAAELGGWSLTKAFNSLANPAGSIMPAEWSAQGVAQFLLAPGLTNAVNAIQVKTEDQKKAEQQAAQEQAARVAAEQYAAQQALLSKQQVEQAQQTYNTAYANARAQADAEAAAAANLQYQLQTNPDYLQSKTNTYLMLGGLAVLAIALWRK